MAKNLFTSLAQMPKFVLKIFQNKNNEQYYSWGKDTSHLTEKCSKGRNGTHELVEEREKQREAELAAK